MCGISGYISSVDKDIREEAVFRMMSFESHRGPDDEGIFSCGNVTLGHKRLSIIDLSGSAHQPMTSSDGRYTIVYNGEVYNFEEIKEELSEYSFRSRTDSEVVLAAYSRWGKDCLDRFNGMFAFAVWDKEKKELFIARDRLGIKPLYYHRNENSFVFSSELGSLLDSGKVKRKMNSEGLWQYLAYQTVFGPGTLVKNVMMLEPGHYMYVRKNDLEITSYWDITQIEHNTQAYP